MKSIRIYITIALLSGFSAAIAQQQVMFTQYMFNHLAINPAYAGSHRTLSVTALARKQWVGLEGAPSTQTLSVHSPIKNQRIGIGLVLINDKIGVTKQTGLYSAYSYRIPFQNGGRLAFGLQIGFTAFNAKFSQVSDTDPTFAGDVKEVQPNVGGGVFYNTKLFYVGFSAPQLIQNTFDRDNLDSDSKMLRHYFLTAGYVFTLNRQLKLKPNILVKAVAGAPVQLDLNLNLLIQEVLWVGASWRSFESIDALLQFQITEKFQFGYSYDFSTTTKLSRVNSGSHEISLNYRVLQKKQRSKFVTPRYF
jgi:type IX secretion system PorP/SprF family membrane protein